MSDTTHLFIEVKHSRAKAIGEAAYIQMVLRELKKKLEEILISDPENEKESFRDTEYITH